MDQMAEEKHSQQIIVISYDCWHNRDAYTVLRKHKRVTNSAYEDLPGIDWDGQVLIKAEICI